MSQKWYSLQQIQAATNLSRSTLVRYEQLQRMPRGIRLSQRCVRYPADEIDLWLTGKWSPPSPVLEVQHDLR